jgi:translocation and assembly module TamB
VAFRKRENPDTNLHAAPQKTKSRRGKLVKFLLVVAILAGVAWFAPWIVSRAPIRQSILAWALPELAPTISVESLQLGWVTPIEIFGLKVAEPGQEPILTCEKISTEKSLWRLLNDRTNLGTVVVDQPNLQVILREDGSNLTDLAKKLPVFPDTPDEDPSSPKIPVAEVKINSGRATIQDLLLNQQTILKDINLLAGISAEAIPTFVLNLTANTEVADSITGDLAISTTCRLPREWTAKNFGVGELTVKCHSFPLLTLQPLLSRIQTDLSMRGVATGDLSGSWKSEDAGSAVLHGKGELAVTDVLIRSPQYLGGDSLDEPSVNAKLDIWFEGDRLRIETCELTSTSLRGNVKMDAPLEIFTTGEYQQFLTDVGSKHQFSARGTADLARLSRSLRHTLRLKDDIRVDEGVIDFQCLAESVEGMRVMRGSISNQRIIGEAGGQLISWEEPTEVRWDMSATSDGWQLRELQGKASFFDVAGQGNLQKGKFDAQADLSKLVARLGQFCDLSGIQLAGKWQGRGSWQTSPDSKTLELHCEGAAQDFQLVSQGQSWTEKDLQLQGDLVAQLNGTQVEQITTAEVTMLSQSDQFKASLITPVSQPFASASFPLRGHVEGDLATWRTRLNPVVSLGNVKTLGKINLDFEGDFSATHVTLTPLELEINNLKLDAPGYEINEPRVALEASFDWQRAQDAVNITSLTLACDALALQGTEIRLAELSKIPVASGSVAFRGDAGKVVGWGAVKNRWTVVPQGAIEGTIRLTQTDNAFVYHASTIATSFNLWQWVPPSANNPNAQGWQPLWQEPRLSCDIDGSITFDDPMIRIEPMKIKGDAIEVTSQGTFSLQKFKADVQGELAYDWQKLSQRLRAMIGPEVEISGQQRQRFRLQGPVFAFSPPGASVPKSLVPAELQGELGLGWERLSAYGLVLGPQQLTARLDRGIVTVSPLQTTVAGGQIRIAPRLDLNQTPLAVILDPPTTIQGVQLTPELVRSWLKYVAPLLADATTVQGLFSLEVTGARIPIYQPALASVMGRVILDDASLEPGPFVQQIVGSMDGIMSLTKQANPLARLIQPGQRWLSVPRQQIDFQMEQGRVYHRNLEARVGELVVRTQGSVGIDQTVDLLAEMPLTDKLLGNDRISATLQGQTLKIPVHGTLTRPELDQRGIAEMGRGMVTNTAERLLQDEIGKGLQRLLGPK